MLKAAFPVRSPMLSNNKSVLYLDGLPFKNNGNCKQKEDHVLD